MNNQTSSENTTSNPQVQRAIIFDFGGVFMKTVDYAPRHLWDDRLHLAHGSVERVVHGSPSWRQAQTGEISLDDYWSDVARQLELTAEDTQQLAHDFYSGDELDHQLVAYARRLRVQGHVVALLSNDSPALLEKLHVLEIDDLFDPLVVSALIGIMKPAPGAYQYILDAVKCFPEQAVFIDDMPANIAGAGAMNIHTIQYTTLPALQAALEPLLSG